MSSVSPDISIPFTCVIQKLNLLTIPGIFSTCQFLIKNFACLSHTMLSGSFLGPQTQIQVTDWCFSENVNHKTWNNVKSKTQSVKWGKETPRGS